MDNEYEREINRSHRYSDNKTMLLHDIDDQGEVKIIFSTKKMKRQRENNNCNLTATP